MSADVCLCFSWRLSSSRQRNCLETETSGWSPSAGTTWRREILKFLLTFSASSWKQAVTVVVLVFVFFTALPEGLVPRDAVLLELAAQSRRGFPPHQTRRLRVLAVLQEGRLRVQQPRHRLKPATCRRPARTRSEGLHFFMKEEQNVSFI